MPLYVFSMENPVEPLSGHTDLLSESPATPCASVLCCRFGVGEWYAASRQHPPLAPQDDGSTQALVLKLLHR